MCSCGGVAGWKSEPSYKENEAEAVWRWAEWRRRSGGGGCGQHRRQVHVWHAVRLLQCCGAFKWSRQLRQFDCSSLWV